MKKLSILGILGMASVLSPGLDLMAYTFEAHPGLYTSYEYTDNYLGAVRDAKSDSIYYVGPSLGLTCTSPSVNLDFTGSYAKNFHERFSEDDSPEIHLTSHASYTTPLQGAQLSYEFSRTLTREFLSEPFGEVRHHNGTFLYNYELSQSTNMNAGYTYLREAWSVSPGEVTALNHEDETTTGGNVGITHKLNPRDTISLSAQQTYYRYEISQDVTSTNGSVHLSHAVSPMFSLGFDTAYNHDDRGHDPSDDRYDARISGQYAFNQTTTMTIGGGYSWLIIEQQDRQSAYNALLSLVKTQNNDRFNLSLAKEYSADFTTNRYGTFDTKSASLAWQRQWWKEWSSNTGISIIKRKPTNGTLGENETDYTTSFTLAWKPIEYFTTDLTYEHLQTKFETSGTARENRYKLEAGVRY